MRQELYENGRVCISAQLAPILLTAKTPEVFSMRNKFFCVCVWRHSPEDTNFNCYRVKWNVFPSPSQK